MFSGFQLHDNFVQAISLIAYPKMSFHLCQNYFDRELLALGIQNVVQINGVSRQSYRTCLCMPTPEGKGESNFHLFLMMSPLKMFLYTYPNLVQDLP